MSRPSLIAFVGGVMGAWGIAELLGMLAPLVRSRLPRLTMGIASISDTVVSVGSAGREPGVAERRRLLAAGGAIAFVMGALVFGPLGGLLLAAGGPWAVARALRARRERYRRAVGHGAAGMAIALADALRGGHSVRAAVGEAADGLAGPAGRELQRVAAELTLGARTEDALEAMRNRARSEGIDAIIAGILLQRRAGGDLALLLRDCARALEDQARLEAEVRTATAQARFTGLIVVLLPLGGGVLAELASPGFLRNLASGFLTGWLVGLALVMQLAAAIMIRRLARTTG